MNKINQLPEKVLAYLDEDFETVDLNKFVDIQNPQDESLDVILGNKNIPGTLYLKNTNGILDERTFVSTNGKFTINNLYTNQNYKYTIKYSDGSDIEDEFIVTPTFPRMLKIGGLRNVRDFGGSMSNFGRLKQGLIIRGSEMNLITYDTVEWDDRDGTHHKIDKTMELDDPCLKSALDHGIQISDEGVQALRDDLKIKTDIDLRYDREAGFIEKSPIGDDVNYYRLSVLGYMNMFRDEFIPVIKQIMMLLTDRKNYPVYIHCWAGADRTGTLLSVLKAYLGVSYEDIVRDHEISTMSIFGTRGRSNQEFTYPEVFEYLETFGKGSLNKNAKAFFKERIGIAEEDLNKIASILCEGSKDINREEYIYNIDNFNACWENEWKSPCWAHNFDEKLRSFPAKNGRVMSFGHRGDIEHYPENSIEGIISAIKMGADGVEIDCCFTKDNVIVLNHGSNLEPTTDWSEKNGQIVNGVELPTSNKIEDWTYLQLQQLNLRFGNGNYSDKNSPITNYKIATLEEALIVCRNRCFVSLDRLQSGGLKSPHWEYIYDLCRRTDAFSCLLYNNTALTKEDADDLRNVVKEKIGFNGVTLFDRTGQHNCVIDWFKEFNLKTKDEFNSYFTECIRTGTYILSNRLTKLIDWIEEKYIVEDKKNEK